MFFNIVMDVSVSETYFNADQINMYKIHRSVKHELRSIVLWHILGWVFFCMWGTFSLLRINVYMTTGSNQDKHIINFFVVASV